MHRWCSSSGVTLFKRFAVVRLPLHPYSKLRTFIIPLASNQVRYYGSHSSHFSYPPPPATNFSPAGNAAPFPYQGQPYAYPPPNHAYYGVPPQQPSPLSNELGTAERPLVITAAPTKASLFSRLWLLLLVSIGISFVLNLLTEINQLSNLSSPQLKSVASSGSPLHGFSSNAEISPVNLDDLDVTFETIRGCDEAKKELQDIVEFLKNPKKFHDLGGRLPKGALMVGPPGCGKTMLAKAIAKEAGVCFFYASGSEFDEMFVGVGSRRVRQLFAAAKENAPSLIFIDEIDALGGKRSRSDHSYSRMTLNQLLAEMDGFQSSDSVIVLAATNTPEALDKALTRPGRLDTTVSVDPPDMRGRSEVLDIYLKKIKVNESVKAMDIARGTTGFTGADLKNLVNMAAIRAATLNKLEVTKDEIEYAKDRVMMGAESTKIISDEERRVTAYHEGAHALVAILLEKEGAEPVHKATIVPRGSGILGLVQQQPEKDRYSRSKKQCLAEMKVCVAGRIGEELLLGPDDITTGASSDFQKATYLASQMVRRFAFNSKLGYADYETPDTPAGAYLSDKTKSLVEDEVKNLLDDAYAQTKELLIRHRRELDSIAQGLLKYETLSGEELKIILKGGSLAHRMQSDKAEAGAGVKKNFLRSN